MKNVLLTASLIMLSSPLLAGLLPDGLAPKQPVPMTEGYGADGSGTHFAVSTGTFGDECIANPVSFDRTYIEESFIRLEAGDIISIPTTVIFDFDGAGVKPAGEVKLSDVYDLLTASGATSLEVVGHTDGMGTEEYNEELGLRRAAAVALVLTIFGFEDTTARSAGEMEPVAPNTHEDGTDNPDGRQQNRRVDIIVTAVKDVEIVETRIVSKPRNQQVFHVLSQSNVVNCGANAQDRRALFWYRNNSYNPSSPYQRGRLWSPPL